MSKAEDLQKKLDEVERKISLLVDQLEQVGRLNSRLELINRMLDTCIKSLSRKFLTKAEERLK